MKWSVVPAIVAAGRGSKGAKFINPDDASLISSMQVFIEEDDSIQLMIQSSHEDILTQSLTASRIFQRIYILERNADCTVIRFSTIDKQSIGVFLRALPGDLCDLIQQVAAMLEVEFDEAYRLPTWIVQNISSVRTVSVSHRHLVTFVVSEPSLIFDRLELHVTYGGRYGVMLSPLWSDDLGDVIDRVHEAGCDFEFCREGIWMGPLDKNRVVNVLATIIDESEDRNFVLNYLRALLHIAPDVKSRSALRPS